MASDEAIHEAALANEAGHQEVAASRETPPAAQPAAPPATPAEDDAPPAEAPPAETSPPQYMTVEQAEARETAFIARINSGSDKNLASIAQDKVDARFRVGESALDARFDKLAESIAAIAQPAAAEPAKPLLTEENLTPEGITNHIGSAMDAYRTATQVETAKAIEAELAPILKKLDVQAEADAANADQLSAAQHPHTLGRLMGEYYNQLRASGVTGLPDFEAITTAASEYRQRLADGGLDVTSAEIRARFESPIGIQALMGEARLAIQEAAKNSGETADATGAANAAPGPAGGAPNRGAGAPAAPARDPDGRYARRETPRARMTDILADLEKGVGA